MRLFASLALAALVALPLALRVREEPASAGARTLVIISPHGEHIRSEFALAFAAWARRELGIEVDVDWRTPGGTSEIIRYLRGAYRQGFIEAFPQHAGQADAIFDARPEAAEAIAARDAFLASELDTGIDLIFGGGVLPYTDMAAQGILVDSGLLASEAEWFRPENIPQVLSGETVYDPQGRFFSACLGAFGIAYSPERLADLGISEPPRMWSDLAGPAYRDEVTLTDPTKSGAAAAIFERVVHTAMGATSGAPEHPDLEAGWVAGLAVIKGMVGNSRAITDSASKPTRDTVRGDCAVSMALDFQAKFEADASATASGGEPRLRFVVPVGGTALSGDPIALLRGAPHRELAVAFLRFVLSPEGQRLWNYRVGTPGGPVHYALRRYPVRADVLDDAWRIHAADPEDDPFVMGRAFTYHPAWTAKLFPVLRPLVKAVCLDVQDELKAAWAAILDAGGPTTVPEAWAAFSWLPVTREQAIAAKQDLGRPATLLPLTRAWSVAAAEHYREAKRLAEAGR